MSTPDANSNASHGSEPESSRAASPTFNFDYEMDRLWSNCEAARPRHSTQLEGETPSPFPWAPLRWTLSSERPKIDQLTNRNCQDRSSCPSFGLPYPGRPASSAMISPCISARGLIGTTTGDISRNVLAKQYGTNLRREKAKPLATYLPDGTNSDFIAPQHTLLALLERPELQAILNQWLKPENTNKLPSIVRSLRPMSISDREPSSFPIVKEWAVDLTELVKEKKARGELLDPLIGRDKELRRLINVLSRHKKNSAVLLGDPGVGKTAIAEGLAQRLVEGNLKVDEGEGFSAAVPESIVARVFNLDLAAILASTACKSAYEQIVKMILDEIVEHEERGIRAIIFIDNLSQIAIGGYRGDGTGMDAATIMKPVLMKGKARVVGCSTVEDFRIHIEKDGALARQFSQIHVCESTPAQTLEILRGIKVPLQRFHKVEILDEALVGATRIATQFFAHKRLPDSAIDLIDETCASATLARSTNSEERDVDEESDRRMIHAQRKLQSLDRKIDDRRSSRKACQTLLRRLNETREKIKIEEDRFERGAFSSDEDRQNAMDTVRKLGIEEETLRDQLERAESGAPNTDDSEFDSSCKPEPIASKMVSKTASYYTFIPAREILDSDDSILKCRGKVIGQQEAVQVVSNAIQCLWVGLKNPRKPIASFLLGGPSGSGKTLLVKEVCFDPFHYLTNDTNHTPYAKLAAIALRQSGTSLRINASDYAESHNITRLIGTPACTGFDGGGQLTECVKRKPFSVVHIKDIERGCVEFRTLMQTILDEGTLRDGDGNIVDFANCIIIISTSVGQTNLRPSMSEDMERKHFLKEIESEFPGEFLSRLDQIVVFRRMTDATLVAMAAYRRIGSARRLERTIRSEILAPLAKLLLEDDVPANQTVVLGVDSLDGGPKRIYPKLIEGGVAPAAEPTEESPPSSPASSYYSFETHDSGEDSPTESLSVDRGRGWSTQTELAAVLVSAWRSPSPQPSSAENILSLPLTLNFETIECVVRGQ
ncbi:P-loop containing nucleoside triphosphate hydrolase protein [Melanogaster broomeanus]|nr:P-loop containing nucleoside triphosphate hydrolase protein [Melanogaster broomeanus]